MPRSTIRLSGTPVEFSYQDSGGPEHKVYTTLVVVHGVCFHSAVFQHVLPLATSKGFRMVCLNRRDYPGTTLYTPAELKTLSEGTEDDCASFIKARGVELAVFLDNLIDALSLPGPASDGKEGGLALMGWSLGNMFTLSTIASVSSFQPQVRHRLQSYVRKLIMFDPPSVALGFPGVPTPAFDPTVPPEEMWTTFAHWITCYFSHGDLSTRNVSHLEYTEPDFSRKSVAASLSPEEFLSLTDDEAASRSDVSFIRFQTVVFDSMRQALFEHKTRLLWPKLDIWLLYCDSSAGFTVYAAWEIEKMAKANEDQPVHISTIRDAHHFVFWDEPEKAMEAFSQCLRH